MKTALTLVLLFLSLTYLHAQIQKGDLLLTLGGVGGINGGGNIGAAFYDTELGLGEVNVLPTLGYALSNRTVLGTTAGFTASLGEGAEAAFYIKPYARYYILNKEKLGLFAQVATDFFTQDGRVIFNEVNLTVGAQLPVAPGILFGPTLDYNLGGPRGRVNFGANFEVRLGRNTYTEDPVVAGFGKGSIMLGTQLLSLSHNKWITQGGLVVGGHYFLTDRLTAVLNVGLGGGRLDYGTSSFPRSYRFNDFSVGLGSRYYLTTQRRLVWFAEGGVGYRRGYVRNNSGGQEVTTRSDNFSLSAGGGAQYFLRQNVSFELAPQVLRTFEGAASSTTLGLNFGARFLIGR